MTDQHCGCRDNPPPNATDLSLLLPERVCNRKGVPLSYLFSLMPIIVEPGSDVPQKAQQVYLVGHRGITVTAVYRDGVLVDPAEYTVYDGTFPDSFDLPAYCVVMFEKLQLDFSGRLYNRLEGDRMTADVIDPRCQHNDIEARLSRLEARLERSSDRFMEQMLASATTGKLAKVISEMVRRHAERVKGGVH